ncbi:MAG TPA: SCO family protein [Blastocatellia bacterium]|nr:SCO family protein [Blastocatellia bacterium]
MKNAIYRLVQGAVAAMLLGAVPLPGYCLALRCATGQEANVQEESAARKYFSDVVLVNQDGKEMRLYSDLIKGKTVIIIPFFTSCTGACPAMNQNLAKIQDWLGDRLGKDAYMISISVDPVMDTVPKLQEYARKFNAKPGWYFLSGKRENVELALTKLGNYVKTREDHNNIMIIGNEKTGLWKKAFSLAPSESLIPVVESVLNDKGDKSK